MILLDTNVVSAVMKLAANPRVVSWLDQQPTDTLFLSTITIAEIEFGLHNLPGGRRRRSLAERFEFFLERGFDRRVLPFDLPASRLYGKLMAHRRSLGRPLSVLDGQIAAIARQHRLAVATRNVRDFEECGVAVVDPFSVDPGGE
ncbi:MAG: type II toxin-antitoxin system VapC family toxin [Acidobacteriota bacterium]|nr:type II toxin-antitoxin system VapC family toxin [Acidobacteriota bacterium]